MTPELIEEATDAFKTFDAGDVGNINSWQYIWAMMLSLGIEDLPDRKSFHVLWRSLIDPDCSRVTAEEMA